MTKITIDDIRVKLADLNNEDLVNSIVNQLTDADKQKQDLEAKEKELNKEIERLRTANGTLLARVSVANSLPLPDDKIDEEAIIKDFSTR